MCPTCYIDQSENGEETAKALTNPAGAQTKTRPGVPEHCSPPNKSTRTTGADFSRRRWEFMLHYQGCSETWIGLTREQADKPWKWVNGTPFNNLFPIRVGGEGASLNDDKGSSSSRCSTGKCWVCSRPA
ncbi:C-type lectin domain family 2 member D-like [Macrochelys suwanniensis]